MTRASESATHEAVSYADVDAAAVRLKGEAKRTPVLTSTTLDTLVQARVFLKCENFQRGGAFKFRGAFNAISRLSPEALSGGVLAYSSGNHAQAVALAARRLGAKAAIVMPEDAPAAKVDATLSYGAEVIRYNKHQTTRESLAKLIAAERGMTLIAPFDHPHVIAGQGTAAKELFEEVGPLDHLLVSCGGGGLISGCAVAAAAVSPGCRVIGVEPEAGDDGARSFHSGTLQTVDNPDTIADGARTSSLGRMTFPLILRYVHDIVTVPDAALVRAMRFCLERMKILVEPTGALPIASLLEGTVTVVGRRVGVIVSGGNVDLKQLARLIG